MKNTLKKLKKVVIILMLVVMCMPTISNAALWDTGSNASIFGTLTKRYNDTNKYTSFMSEVSQYITKDLDTSISTDDMKNQFINKITELQNKSKYQGTESIQTAATKLKTTAISSDVTNSFDLFSILGDAVEGLLGGINLAVQSLSPDVEPEIYAETAGSISGSDYRVKLTGEIYLKNKNSKKWVVLVHGVMMNGQAMADSVGQMYIDQGFNILAPDSRGHGDSDGSVAMGYLESLDLWDWLGYLQENYAPDEVIIHGVSLGGATTVFASGLNINGQTLKDRKVIGLVEDCGYTSLTGIITGMLGKSDSADSALENNTKSTDLIETIIGLPEGVLKDLSGTLDDTVDNVVAELLITLVDVGLTSENFNQKQNALVSLKNCDIPLLIIHGTLDTTVPYKNSETIFEVAEKYSKIPYIQKYTADFQAHAFITLGTKYNEYEGHVENFIKEAENIAKGGKPVSRISNYEYDGSNDGTSLITSLLKALKLIKNILFN